MPTKILLVFAGLICMLPTAAVLKYPSDMFSQVIPPSIVFQTANLDQGVVVVPTLASVPSEITIIWL